MLSCQRQTQAAQSEGVALAKTVRSTANARTKFPHRCPARTNLHSDVEQVKDLQEEQQKVATDCHQLESQSFALEEQKSSAQESLRSSNEDEQERAAAQLKRQEQAASISDVSTQSRFAHCPGVQVNLVVIFTDDLLHQL